MVLIGDGDQETHTQVQLPVEKEKFDGIRVGIGGYNKEIPPNDDVCPICFDTFSIPCRSNCGHWFCASCIIHFWMFGSSIQPCKCPLCYSRIVSLKPETPGRIQPADDDADALKKVHQYNGLYSRGAIGGAFHSVRVFSILMKKMFKVLIDPEVMRCTYYILRLFGMFLAVLYEIYECEFVPTGSFGIQRMFDKGASVIAATLFFVGIAYRWMFGDRVMHLVAGYLDLSMIFFLFAFFTSIRSLNLNS